jgi:GMC oxidoreductase
VATGFGADRPDLYERFTVQDLTPPRALVDTFRRGYAIVTEATQPDLHPDSAARMLRDAHWNTNGAMNHSLGFLIMAHDSSDGRIVLDDGGQPQIDWPGAPSEPIYERINEILRGAVEQIGGHYLPNPRWSSHLLGNNLLTAHPLGGCGTADDASAGVVDDAGRVFAPGGGVYDGLRVCDGSVVPRALAVNPLVTTLINPVVDVPLRLISKVWSPWHGATFDADSGTESQRVAAVTRLAVKCVPPPLGKLEDDLVELVPNTHLGRILVRGWGIGPARIGYIALRQTAGVAPRG